jgi:hypothetical protein
MAADITEITDSNQEHLLCDLHEIVRILTKFERVLDRASPLLDQFTTPAATYLASRRVARREARNGRD